MQYRIRVENTGPIAEGKAPEIIQDGLDRFVTEVVMLLERAVKDLTPVGVFGAQGGLLSTIHGEVMGHGTPAVSGIVGHSSLYGEVVEQGRSPGKPMPPPGVLLSWLRLKFGDSVEIGSGKNRRVVKIEQAEYMFRRAIGKKGFHGEWMFESGLHMSKDKIAAIADECGLQISIDLNGT